MPRGLAILTAVSNRIIADCDRIVNDVHHEVHGRDMPDAFLEWGRRTEAIVQFTVEAFEYPRSDAPPQLSFVGPLSATGAAVYGRASCVVERSFMPLPTSFSSVVTPISGGSLQSPRVPTCVRRPR